MQHLNEETNGNIKCDCCRDFFHTSDLHEIFQDNILAVLCTTCKRDREELLEEMDQEPECSCQQTDVDLFDARGCDAHDSNSPWNVRMRALCASERCLSMRLWPMGEVS